jgi:hypothetical protein
MKSSFLFSSALLITLAFLAGAATIAIVTFLSLAFFLTLLESLIRADAVELLGTDLIRVTGLVGILMSFEGMVAASFVTILVTGFLNVGSSTEALLVLAAAVAVILILSFFHSYLLLVRFSAIAIMRRNAVEI